MNSAITSSIWKTVSLMSRCHTRVAYNMLGSRRPFFSHGHDLNLLTGKRSSLPCLISKPRFASKIRKLARLTEFPVLTWPSFFHMQGTLFLERFLINDYDDPSFDYGDFVLLAQSMVDHVSACISVKDFNGLRKVCTPDAVQDVRDGITDESMEDLSHFWTNSKDIVFSFPHNISTVEYDGSTKVSEIWMVFHVVKGSYKRTQNPKAPLFPSEQEDNVQILNYSFIRLLDVQDGSLWVVNGLNHLRIFDSGKSNQHIIYKP